MTSPALIDCPIELVKGKQVALCSCGYSKKLPLCDGSHKGKQGELRPVLAELSADGSKFSAVPTRLALVEKERQAELRQNPDYRPYILPIFAVTFIFGAFLKDKFGNQNKLTSNK